MYQWKNDGISFLKSKTQTEDILSALLKQITPSICSSTFSFTCLSIQCYFSAQNVKQMMPTIK